MSFLFFLRGCRYIKGETFRQENSFFLEFLEFVFWGWENKKREGKRWEFCFIVFKNSKRWTFCLMISWLSWGMPLPIEFISAINLSCNYGLNFGRSYCQLIVGCCIWLVSFTFTLLSDFIIIFSHLGVPVVFIYRQPPIWTLRVWLD